MRLRRYRHTVLPQLDPVREKILDAAARLFAEQGFAATSVEQVVARCEIGKDTLYRRFPSKLALFEAMALRERDRVEARFDEFVAQTEGSTLDQLKRAARWLLDVNLEPRLIAYKRIAFSEARIVGQAVQQAPSRITDHFIRLISDLQDQGLCRADAPERIVAYLTNALVLAPMMHAMLGNDFDNETRNQHFDEAWSFIVQGIKSGR